MKFLYFIFGLLSSYVLLLEFKAGYPVSSKKDIRNIQIFSTLSSLCLYFKVEHDH